MLNTSKHKIQNHRVEIQNFKLVQYIQMTKNNLPGHSSKQGFHSNGSPSQ